MKPISHGGAALGLLACVGLASCSLVFAPVGGEDTRGPEARLEAAYARFAAAEAGDENALDQVRADLAAVLAVSGAERGPLARLLGTGQADAERVQRARLLRAHLEGTGLLTRAHAGELALERPGAEEGDESPLVRAARGVERDLEAARAQGPKRELRVRAAGELGLWRLAFAEFEREQRLAADELPSTEVLAALIERYGSARVALAEVLLAPEAEGEDLLRWRTAAEWAERRIQELRALDERRPEESEPDSEVEGEQQEQGDGDGEGEGEGQDPDSEPGESGEGEPDPNGPDPEGSPEEGEPGSGEPDAESDASQDEPDGSPGDDDAPAEGDGTDEAPDPAGPDDARDLGAEEDPTWTREQIADLLERLRRAEREGEALRERLARIRREPVERDW